MFLYPPPIVDSRPTLQQKIVPVKVPNDESNTPPLELFPIPPPIVAPTAVY